MTSTALVYGLAISGEAVARALHDRGVRVLVADDAPNDVKAAAAASFGAELVAKPDAATILKKSLAFMEDSSRVQPRDRQRRPLQPRVVLYA